MCQTFKDSLLITAEEIIMIIIFPTFLGTPGKKLILGLKLRGGDGWGEGGVS